MIDVRVVASPVALPDQVDVVEEKLALEAEKKPAMAEEEL